MDPSHACLEGELLKRRILQTLAARRETYVCYGRRVLLLRLLEFGEATIDDVRAVVKLPPDINPKVFGVVPTQLAEAGIIRSIGTTKTKRPEAHARKIDVWALADRDAALFWLVEHPDQLSQRPDATGVPVIDPIQATNCTGLAAEPHCNSYQGDLFIDGTGA